MSHEWYHHVAYNRANLISYVKFARGCANVVSYSPTPFKWRGIIIAPDTLLFD
jgi:hypothetical protein